MSEKLSVRKMADWLATCIEPPPSELCTEVAAKLLEQEKEIEEWREQGAAFKKEIERLEMEVRELNRNLRDNDENLDELRRYNIKRQAENKQQQSEIQEWREQEEIFKTELVRLTKEIQRLQCPVAVDDAGPQDAKAQPDEPAKGLDDRLLKLETHKAANADLEYWRDKIIAPSQRVKKLAGA